MCQTWNKEPQIHYMEQKHCTKYKTALNMKVFQIQNTLYQIQTLLNKYKIYFLPTTEHLYVAPNNRIAKTYQNHNTRPHTKYKQHTPYQIQNECIATIHQIQNHGKNNTHIILHTKYRKTHFTTPNTEHCSTKNLYQIQDTQCSTIQTEHCSIQICPYQCRNLHLIVVVVC